MNKLAKIVKGNLREFQTFEKQIRAPVKELKSHWSRIFWILLNKWSITDFTKQLQDSGLIEKNPPRIKIYAGLSNLLRNKEEGKVNFEQSLLLSIVLNFCLSCDVSSFLFFVYFKKCNISRFNFAQQTECLLLSTGSRAQIHFNFNHTTIKLWFKITKNVRCNQMLWNTKNFDNTAT